MNPLLDRETETLILKILKRGDSVELKKENGKLVIVEIRRQVKQKTVITG